MVEKDTVVAPGAWCGEARSLLDDLAYSLSEARRDEVRWRDPRAEEGAAVGLALGPGPESASGRGVWRADVLSSLSGLRDVLVEEATARPAARGSRVLRDRSRLLADLSLQQGQLRTANDDDRILYDLRRLLVQARLHVQASQEA